MTLEIRDFLLYFVVTFLIISITSSIFKILTNASKAAQHLKSAKKKRALRDQQLKQINISPLDISETLREKILNSEATTLLEMLRSREVTSEQILLTYFTRASTIGLENEMITEINFEDALSQARRCDKLRKENPSACKGVLFGLPISIKDTLILKNTDASCGLASKLFNPATEDGYIVKILKGEGAIPFIKSNVPQALMTIDSRNNIWGRTKNPWNKERGAGGSSGGECALIAARCSPLGIGNDLGGSLRTPAFFCGVTGFKPTSGRITKAGTEEVALTLDYLPCLKLATGPLAKSAKDVSLMMKALLSDQAHQKIPLSEQDPHYVRIPWREDMVNQKNKGLRIGYFKNIDFFASSPANSRAVDEAVRALKNRGHQIVEVDFPNIKDLIPFYTQALLADGEARFLVDALKGESPIEEHSRLASAAATPQILAKILRPLLNLLGEKRLVMILDNFKKRDAYECNQLIAKQEKLTKEFLKVWDSEKLDALISPGAAYPATKHGVVKDIIHGVCYAYIFNVLDMPTGAVPVTLVKEEEDQYPKEMSKYHDMMFKLTAENMKGSVGLPVGVQVTTLPWQEEKCVSVMIELENELQFRKKHGYPL